jgi:hypothetical protein
VHDLIVAIEPTIISIRDPVVETKRGLSDERLRQESAVLSADNVPS